ncbi:MAG: acyl-CoA dehydrogenase family protein [Pseudomonadota bacterium]
MEFALSEDQRLLQDSINGFLEKASPLDTVREAAAGDTAVRAGVSEGLAEMGSASLFVPEAHDGLGLGVLEAVLVQEALGAAVAPARFIGDVVAAAAFRWDGNRGQQAEFLPKIASGEAKFAIALTESVAAREGAGVTASGGKLSGTAMFAMDGGDATHILVADRAGLLHVVAAGDAAMKPLQTIDRTRTFHELTFDNAAAERLPNAAADDLIRLARVLLAADTLGASTAMLDKAVAYAKERKQFGRVIGSFQAVKHMCAEMAAEIEPARALVWQAAHAMDTNDPEAPLMANLVKSHLAEIGTFVARASTEVHGGMGFTDLVGLHFWFKRIGVNRQLLGSPEAVREDAARLQGWAA